MLLTPGTRLGPYEIVSPIGAGGMGEVYRARDTRLGRDVAIKVLPQHLSTNAEVRARFEREARTVSSLNHPHVCTLFDVGRDGAVDYLVMELVEGQTLAQRLASGALPTGEVLRLGAQIADALDRAHRAGVVHRDLKPGNVMLTKGGAKLMDFGLARATGLSAPGGASGATEPALTQSPTVAGPLTAEGTIVGTFQYMSPEQLEGKEADPRSDVWALGCVLYEMASGRRAFEGRSQASLISAIMTSEPAPISQATPTSPPALERVVRACLEKDPNDRLQSAHDVRLQLEWIRSEPARPGPPTAASARRRPALWLAAAALLVVAAAAAFLAGRGTAPGIASVSFTQKTFRPQAIFTARYAPDGKTIVLSAALEGSTPSLFVIRPEYPEPRPLGLDGVHLLSVSSKGELAVLTHARYVGLHRLFTGTLARLPMEGAAPRELLDGVREADWSPDGEELAIIRDVGGRDRLEFPIGKVLHESAGYLSDPRVSPRGDRVAFMEHPSRFDDRGSVDVVDRGGRVRILSSGYWGEEGVAWSLRGDEVFFMGSYTGSDLTVYAVDLQGRRRIALQSAGGLTLHDIGRDGRWLATRDDEPIGLVARGPGGAAERDLSWLGGALGPTLSHDGRAMLFTDQSDAAGINYDVCIRSTDGSPIVRLGEGVAEDLSPDGKSAVAIVRAEPPRLMLYPTGAGAAARLDHGAFEKLDTARWLDGERLLVSGSERGKPPRCYVVEVGSGAMRPVTPEGTWRGIASSDGRRLITRDQQGWSLSSLAGGPRAPVTALSNEDEVARWSADGRWLYVYRVGTIPMSLDRVDVSSGRRERVRELAPADRAWLLGVITVSLADDPNSYAYSYWRYMSTLFEVGGAR